MSKEKLPSSMQEACTMLKANLSDEDILLIKQGKVDTTDMHFTLGLWIRNNWIYKGLAPEALGLRLMFIDADDFSEHILKAFVKYIKKSK